MAHGGMAEQRAVWAFSRCQVPKQGWEAGGAALENSSRAIWTGWQHKIFEFGGHPDPLPHNKGFIMGALSLTALIESENLKQILLANEHRKRDGTFTGMTRACFCISLNPPPAPAVSFEGGEQVR